jgi:hypothetical protein
MPCKLCKEYVFISFYAWVDLLGQMFDFLGQRLTFVDFSKKMQNNGKMEKMWK